MSEQSRAERIAAERAARENATDPGRRAQADARLARLEPRPQRSTSDDPEKRSE